MSKVISILLIMALGFQCLSKLGLIAYYNINIEYIITELCENKDKPELKCNGKCYLKKKLGKANEAEKQTAGILKQSEFPVFISTSYNPEILRHIEVTILPGYIKNLYSLSLSKAIFHPPSLS